jgi:transcriptional repressor NrdR
MKCPACGNMETKVVDSRVVEDGKTIRRRRSCEYCEHRFSTGERVVVIDLVVLKKDDSKELYDRDKLKRALIIAFGKKDFSLEKIDSIILKLEAKRSGKTKEITSVKIGEDLLMALKEESEVAYVRFASVFMEFDGLKDFSKLLE